MFSKSRWLIIQCIITSLFLQYYLKNKISYLIYNRLTNTIYLYNNYEKLAFSFLSVNTNSNVKGINKILSSEIVIKGINNYLLKRKLSYLFNKLSSRNKHIEKDKILVYINRLKLSGFFKSVNFNIYYIDTHQIIVLDVIPNSIVQNVYVLNYQDKLISTSYILFLFRLQLGYPKNFIEIDYTIDQIKKWYYFKGYQYVKINLYDNHLDDNSIILKICEGKITVIEIINSTTTNLYNNKARSLFINLIIKILHIEPNQILNTKLLENGIAKLKIRKILWKCNYEITTNNQSEETVSVKLKIEVIDNGSTYLIMKNIFFSHNLLESLELFLQYSLDYLLFNYLESNLLFNYPMYFLGKNITLLITNQDRSLYINMSDNDNAPYKILNEKNIDYNQKIYEWYITPMIFIAGNHLGFRHNIQHINYTLKSFIIDVHYPQQGLYFNLQYQDPWINLVSHNPSFLNIRIFRNNYLYSQNSLPVLLDQINSQFYSDQNSFFCKRGTQIGLKHELNINLALIEKISLQEISKKISILYNYLFWDYLIHPLKISYINNIYSQFKLINLDQIQNFFNFKLNFVYHDFSTLNCFSFNTKFNIEFIIFISENLQVPNQYLEILTNYSSCLKCKIAQNHRVNLIPYNFQDQFLNYNLEFISSFTSNYNFPFSEIFFLLSPDRVRGYKEKLYYLPNMQCILLNLEYHILLKNKNTIFLFLDYLYNIKYIKNYNNIDTLYLLYNLNHLYQYLGYGIGIQVQVPIQQIPPVRIEYGLNMNNNTYLHLRIYYY